LGIRNIWASELLLSLFQTVTWFLVAHPSRYRYSRRHIVNQDIAHSLASFAGKSGMLDKSSFTMPLSFFDDLHPSDQGHRALT
jgi:hypothetical protein